MDPGGDCLSCHGGQVSAPRWTVAGTLYGAPYVPGSAGLEGAHVLVTDANGRSLTLRTNRVGNFYTAESLAFPLHVCAVRGGTTSCMGEAVTRGSCNVCHGPHGATTPEAHAAFFPIGAGTAHAAVGCNDCHGEGAGPASHLCATCHAALDRSLEARHTVSTSNPLVVVKDFAPESAACLRCHGDAQVDRTVDHPAGFEGAPPHHGATCLLCHDAFRADKPWAADFATRPQSWPPGSGHGCLRCHTGGVPGGGNDPSGGRGP
jgi:hypothetical protein